MYKSLHKIWSFSKADFKFTELGKVYGSNMVSYEQASSQVEKEFLTGTESFKYAAKSDRLNCDLI